MKCGGPQARRRSRCPAATCRSSSSGREILQQPKLLVVAQPTWGVDVGAAAFIRQALIDLRTAGTAVLVISEELDELFEICDRIAVIANGRLSPAKRTADTNVEEIGVWMSGMWPGAEPAPESSACGLGSKRGPSRRTRCAMRRRCLPSRSRSSAASSSSPRSARIRSKGFRVFFLSPLKDAYGVAELLLKATPLMLIAVGLAVGFRANVWNIGAEGQFIVGAIAGGGVALHFDGQHEPAAAADDGRRRRDRRRALGVDPGAAADPLQRQRDPRLADARLHRAARRVVARARPVEGSARDSIFRRRRCSTTRRCCRSLVEGTRLNAAFLLALGALLAGYVFMQRSFIGFQMQVAGEAEAAARYAGFSARRTIWTGMLAGGAMAGIAGMGEVAGPMGQLTEHVSNNYGFAAIIVAFVGRLNPVGIFFASLLMALLYLGGEQAQQYLNLPSSISKVFQGMLLFFLLGADVFVNYRLRWSGAKRKGDHGRQHPHLDPRRDDRRRHAAHHRGAGRARHREVGRAEPRRRRA